MRHVLAAAAVLVVVGGCGSASVVVTGETVATPYDGPMSLPVDHSDEASVEARSGAAGRALECDGTPYDGGGADYEGGLASTQDGPAEALANLFEKDFRPLVPADGYRIERRDDGRALLSFDVDGRTRVAYVAADDVVDFEHHRGWGIEAWAQCDPAELPAAVTDDLSVEVWTDATGTRVPIGSVQSYRGAEHCDWQRITFLEIGLPARPAADQVREEYVRDPSGELAELLRTTWSARAKLPADAKDTGWRHGGRELWLVPDRSAAYLVDVDDPGDVERWPASKEQIGCA